VNFQTKYTYGRNLELKSATKAAIALEEKYGAHNYHPLPVFWQEAKECLCGC